ncbi:hypothetical protein OU787_17475 [Kitasatospora sp. YST-16]|nr:hypothetical protein [Kitasatospora sp. YST-16]WAL73141.1 hypothetical protein OU787_17475 [Kitasatospora sp. YST-16]WNW39195.1 hypothetical protein RKE32_17440 [Streptomyces sp. Li-HN-5-13]
MHRGELAMEKAEGRGVSNVDAAKSPGYEPAPEPKPSRWRPW